MTDFREKIQKIRAEQANVRDARRKLRAKKHNFKCVEEVVYAKIDDFSGGAHTISAVVGKCGLFQKGKLCANKSCKNYGWLCGYVPLYKGLQAARKKRNNLYVEYFWIFKKISQFKTYKKWDKVAKSARKSVFHWYCKTLYNDDSDQLARDEKISRIVGDAYEEILKRRDAARAEFFGRKK